MAFACWLYCERRVNEMESFFGRSARHHAVRDRALLSANRQTNTGWQVGLEKITEIMAAPLPERHGTKIRAVEREIDYSAAASPSSIKRSAIDTLVIVSVERVVAIIIDGVVDCPRPRPAGRSAKPQITDPGDMDRESR